MHKINQKKQLTDSLVFNFSHSFDGVIWNLQAMPGASVLVMEIRNEENRRVSFSALNFSTNSFLWESFQVQEPWWIGLSAVTPSVLLLQQYHDIQNPERKTLIALDVFTLNRLWTRENFSLTDCGDGEIFGYSTDSEPTALCLDVRSGAVLSQNVASRAIDDKIFDLVRPFQYSAETEHFNTVSRFVWDKMQIHIVLGVEYVENNGMILIAYYCQEAGLANYLLVLSEDGEIILHEKLGDNLKGLGLDSFFILAGCLFFVKNKTTLLSYRIV